jgi:hypothetical protein
VLRGFAHLVVEGVFFAKTKEYFDLQISQYIAVLRGEGEPKHRATDCGGHGHAGASFEEALAFQLGFAHSLGQERIAVKG